LIGNEREKWSILLFDIATDCKICIIWICFYWIYECNQPNYFPRMLLQFFACQYNIPWNGRHKYCKVSKYPLDTIHRISKPSLRFRSWLHLTSIKDASVANILIASYFVFLTIGREFVQSLFDVWNVFIAATLSHCVVFIGSREFFLTFTSSIVWIAF
jgi:hypothetical protein